MAFTGPEKGDFKGGAHGRLRLSRFKVARKVLFTANFRTKILYFRGFDSSMIWMFSGGILMSIGNFPEVLSQGILVGIILVGRLGVLAVISGRVPVPQKVL